MSQLELRPATRDDITTFSKFEKAPTIRGWVAELEGENIALGGLAKVEGRNVGFFELTDKARDLLANNMYVRAFLVKAAYRVLKAFKDSGVRFVYAAADTTKPKAAELLEAIGFEKYYTSDTTYIWDSEKWRR